MPAARGGGGGIGPISTAPVINGPSVPGEIAQAIGQFPQQQQQYQMQQAELDATNIDNSSKKLAVLTKLISANPNLASNPQLIQAAQRSFKGLGMDAPLKNIGGVQSLDTDALYAFGPSSEFIASNLSTLLSFPPDQRAALIQAATGTAIPDGVAKQLSNLPQRVISTPTELSGLYGKAQQAIANLRFPGATVDGAIAIIRPINQVLQQNGMPGIDMEDLDGASAYQALINQANLQGLQGGAAEKFAQAGLAKIRTELAPQLAADATERAQADTTRAAASTVSANASASRAASYAARTPAAIAHDYATADQAEAQTKKLVQEVATGSASLKDLEANANNGEALVARLESDLNDPTQGINTQITAYKAAHPEATVANDPQLKELNDSAYDTENRIKQARRASATAQAAFQQGQAHLHSGSPTSGTPQKGPGAPAMAQHLTATSGGKPIHSDDGGKTWLPGP
jgi:hypothetical protein